MTILLPLVVSCKKINKVKVLKVRPKKRKRNKVDLSLKVESVNFGTKSISNSTNYNVYQDTMYKINVQTNDSNLTPQNTNEKSVGIQNGDLTLVSILFILIISHLAKFISKV